jgi:hypothetical protein
MVMNKERCIVLIDGSNFYFKLKNLQLHNLLNLDFSGFVGSLINGNDLVGTTYYVGAVRTDGTPRHKPYSITSVSYSPTSKNTTLNTRLVIFYNPTAYSMKRVLT